MQKTFIALLLLGGSVASAAAYAQSTTGDPPAWAAEAQMNPDYDSLAPAAEPEAAPAGSSGATPAWAAEATMNPDYIADGPSPTNEPSDAAPGDAVATPAWAAEAAMNPDYQPDAPAASDAATTTAEPPAPAAASAPSPSEPGVTQYFGTSESTGSPAWAADAKMNPDYAAASPAAAPPAPAAATPAAGAEENSPARQQQIEACRDALNGEVQTARLMFGSGKWDILPVSYAGLDRIAKIAKDCGDVVIEVDGHTDNTGKADSNVTISVLRAEAVVKYLIRAGVDAANLRAIGHGGTKPIASNETAAGRQKNRRIDFIVWDNGHPPS